MLGILPTCSGRAWSSASTRSCACCAARPSRCTPTDSRFRTRDSSSSPTATRASTSRSRVLLPHRPAGRGQARHRHAVDRRHGQQGMDLLAQHWNTWEEVALENGHVADRSKWRLVGPMHLAETREQAERDVEYGIVEFSRYFTHILPAARCRATPRPRSSPTTGSRASRSSARPRTRSPRSRNSSRRATAASARSCCSTTTGPLPRRSCTATNSSRST